MSLVLAGKSCVENPLGCCENALGLRLYLEFKHRRCHSWQFAMEKAVFTVHGLRLSWNFLLWIILWKRSHRNLLFQVVFGLIVDTYRYIYIF